ncbi:MAG: type 4a pilus biogenesis protein PilO [Pseudobdellovibrionaceae bacterium]
MASKIEESLSSLSMPKVVIVGLGLAGMYYWLMFPDVEKIKLQISQTRQELEIEKAKQAETQAAQKRQEELKQELADLSGRFSETSNRLPTEVNSSTLNKQINDVAKASGSVLKEIIPLPPTLNDFIEQIPVQVAAEGAYGEIVLFLYYLATGERISRIGNFDMVVASTQPTAGGKQRPVRVAFRGTAVSFRFVPEAVKKADEGAPK